jgi:L-asparaginase
MRGERAVPALDAAGLVAGLPKQAAPAGLVAEDVLQLPGPHITLADAHTLARRAVAAAAAGEGVVVTTGTDTLEELAILCALLHDVPAPIVLTGANRPASSPGADGPANLHDAVALAGAPIACGLGVTVVFGGEIHAATTVRKVDSTGPAAFGSPITGPVGRVVDGRVWLAARPIAPPTLDPATLQGRVPIVTAALGEDGTALRGASREADGVVMVAFGAGHLSVGLTETLREVAGRLPVVLTLRPERGAMLHATYGFTGSEHDLRSSGAIPAPFLSAVAARVALLCCLGAGMGRAASAALLAHFDA